MPQFVIAQPAGCKRRKLFQVKQTPNGLIGREPDDSIYTGDAVTYRIKADEIVVHLPDDPPLGKVYGVGVEPIHARWAVRGWGTVFSYVPSLDEAARARLEKALQQSRGKVERQFPGSTSDDLITRVKHPKGKIAGTYQYRPKATDVLTLYPQITMGLREHVKVITHELGHRVWFRSLTPEQRARWVKLYQRYVTVSTVSVSDVKRMVQGIRQIASVRDYQHDCEPEDQIRLKIYMSWIAKVHKLSPQHVQDLVATGEQLPVPDVHLHRSDVDTPITMYSKTSADEMFCEALSSHMVGDLTDKRMLNMLSQR